MTFLRRPQSPGRPNAP